MDFTDPKTAVARTRPDQHWQRTRIQAFASIPSGRDLLYRVGPPSEDFPSGAPEYIPWRMKHSLGEMDSLLTEVTTYISETLASEGRFLTPQARGEIRDFRAMANASIGASKTSSDNLHARWKTFQEAEVCLVVLALCDHMDGPRRVPIAALMTKLENMNMLLLPNSPTTARLRKERKEKLSVPIEVIDATPTEAITP